MARFAKGNNEGRRFDSGELAAEMQRRSAASRKKNRLLADVVRRELSRKAPGDSKMTKMEFLAAKAIMNHATGDVTFHDLRELQKILGEDVQRVNLEGNGIRIILADEADAEAVGNIINRQQ